MAYIEVTQSLYEVALLRGYIKRPAIDWAYANWRELRYESIMLIGGEDISANLEAFPL